MPTPREWLKITLLSHLAGSSASWVRPVLLAALNQPFWWIFLIVARFLYRRQQLHAQRGEQISRSEALDMGCRHACHVAIWAPVGYSLWRTVPARYAVLMQMRFDGLIGFPGGLVDKKDDGSLEDLATAANRELAEELSANLCVSNADYLGCIYLADEDICTHLFEKKVTEGKLNELERDALSAKDRFEVCGTLRCPCYALPDKVGPRATEPRTTNKGFGLFIQQKFAGNALQQARSQLTPPFIS